MKRIAKRVCRHEPVRNIRLHNFCNGFINFKKLHGGKHFEALPIAEWDEILETLEELDDIKAYDAAKARSEDSISFEQAVRELTDDCAP
mgnify:CR=1 FL=1